LFVAGEISASILNTLHNLYFYLDTMRSIRKAIEFGTFESFKDTFLETYSLGQLEPDA
jgi:queuine tRNA-ribosyltransferase